MASPIACVGRRTLRMHYQWIAESARDTFRIQPVQRNGYLSSFFRNIGDRSGSPAGFYPALVMSTALVRLLAIKNKVTVNNGNLSLRKILVVVQFGVITIILIISTLSSFGRWNLCGTSRSASTQQVC